MRLWSFAVIVFAIVIVYGQTLTFDFVRWDDDSLVFRNPIVMEVTPAGIAKAFTSYDPELYIPLTLLSFQLENFVFGLNPGLFHFTNVLLHALNACLVFFLLKKLGLKEWTAFFCALIFAVHPINVEAVAWISARKDLLSSFFGLLATLAFLRYRETNERRTYIASLVFLLCGLLSKASIVILPAVWVLLDYLQSRKIRAKEYVLPALLTLAILLIGLFGKTENIGSLGVFETLLLSAKSLMFSLVQWFLPFDLSVLYQQNSVISVFHKDCILSILGIFGIVGIFYVLYRRKSLPKIFFAAPVFYTALLLPSFANFSKGEDVYFFSDRYMYLSQIGLLFLIGFVSQTLLAKRPERKTFAAALASVYVLSLSVLAFAQTKIWKNSDALYASALAHEADNTVMLYNQGLLAQERGDLTIAEELYERALRSHPCYAKAIYNLGLIHVHNGDREGAKKMYARAMLCNPDSAEPYNGLGVLLMTEREIDAAIIQFQTAISLNAHFAQAHINLADAYGKKEMYEEALSEFRKAFTVDPGLRKSYPEVEKQLELID